MRRFPLSLSESGGLGHGVIYEDDHVLTSVPDIAGVDAKKHAKDVKSALVDKVYKLMDEVGTAIFVDPVASLKYLVTELHSSTSSLLLSVSEEMREEIVAVLLERIGSRAHPDWKDVLVFCADEIINFPNRLNELNEQISDHYGNSNYYKLDDLAKFVAYRANAASKVA